MIKKENFNGQTYAATGDEPTEFEVNYILDNLERLLEKTGSYDGDDIQHDLHCDCYKESGTNSDKVEMYAFRLNEDETDIPVEDWDDQTNRIIYLLRCTVCNKFCLCD